jgi:hypothetical protein
MPILIGAFSAAMAPETSTEKTAKQTMHPMNLPKNPLRSILLPSFSIWIFVAP